MNAIQLVSNAAVFCTSGWAFMEIGGTSSRFPLSSAACGLTIVNAGMGIAASFESLGMQTVHQHTRTFRNIVGLSLVNTDICLAYGIAPMMAYVPLSLCVLVPKYLLDTTQGPALESVAIFTNLLLLAQVSYVKENYLGLKALLVYLVAYTSDIYTPVVNSDNTLDYIGTDYFHEIFLCGAIYCTVKTLQAIT